MKKIIVGNWKMNKTISETEEFLKPIIRKSLPEDREIVICPPFTSLSAAAQIIKGSKIFLGAQNICHEENGAYTGEISAAMLKDIGVAFVLLGHSERRQLFHESDQLIGRKIHAAVKAHLAPILCVGETLAERESHKTEQIVKAQLRNCLSSLTIKNLIVAYEPVWAIGTGRNATPEQAEEVHSLIKNLVRKNCPNARILYGGSVTPDNAAGFLGQLSIDGVLVGGASLDAKKFAQIMAL